jgi:nucleotide-binding universal stress UspA family protein
MFDNVLVGVDGSSNGRDGIALAARLLGAGGKLTLANVYGDGMQPLPAITPGLQAEELEGSARMLEQERAAVDVEAELLSIVGASAGGALHRQAEEQHADLLVVGSCSRGPIGRVMLGDDTRQALNGAPCAVAIASKGYSKDRKPIARVGVAYNDSAESNAALEAARQLAATAHASLAALEVVAIPTYAYTGLMPPAMGENLDVMLEEASARMARLAGVEGRAVYGVAGEELAAFGDEVDILVVGSRSYGPWRRLVLGSTSDYLERHARCSLLVLPRAAAATHAQPAASQAGAGAGAAA